MAGDSPADFIRAVDRWAGKAERRMLYVARHVPIECLRMIIWLSPVDTGRFRGNWQVQIGSVPDGELYLVDPAGDATLSKGTAVAMGLTEGDIVYIANNLPYAMRLENGWSKQAPAGMVAVTVGQFGSILMQVIGNAARID